MDVSTIIWLSRKQTSTTTWQISDADYLKYLNIVYKEIFSRLSVASKKYTWQTYTTDVVAWQSEYIIPEATDEQTWIKLVLDVFLDGEKIKVYDTNIDSNVYNKKHQLQSYWILRDWSIFLYPAPTHSIEWWLRVEWKYIPMDLLLTDTDVYIKLPAEYHNVLVKWLNSLVFGEKQIFDKQQLWENYYLTAIQQMMTEWSMENESGYHVEDADLSFLE
jgi:hypothetical protein